MDRLARKWETARGLVPRPEVQESGNDGIGILAYGTSHWAVVETLDQLRHEQNIEAGYCRVRGYPFNREVIGFIRRHQRVYVVEQNRDAQLLGLLRLDLEPELIGKLRSVLHYDGLPIDARSVTDSIVTQEIGGTAPGVTSNTPQEVQA
jgi:2-oxoglutarate/2-oxoacid ferredoxin oxidoreductase subunit alpha